jgi:hypothetical protein
VECLSYDDYVKEITDVSFDLLKKFLKMMEGKGIQPIIIGGWAVEAFKKSKGSKDIDIVIRGSDVDKLLSDSFFEEGGMDEVQQGWPLHHEKKISVHGKEKTIICDIFNSDVPREDYEKRGITLHWNLVPQFQESRNIEGIPVLVPKRELLIITKIIAAVDRLARYDRTGHVNLISKILKDYYDIAVLINLDQELDKEFLKKYIKAVNLTQHMNKFLLGYKQDYRRTLDEVGITFEKIESALKV